MPTIFHTLTHAVADALAGLPDVAGRVYLDLDHALASDRQPAIAIEPGDDDSQDFGDAEQQGNFDIRLHIVTAGSPTIDQADPIELAAHQRLMQDRTLGGITWLSRTGGARRVRGEGGQIGQRTVTYRAVVQVGALTLRPIQA